jgi:hypothetical protein
VNVLKAPADPSLHAESSLREKIIEHAFIAALLRVLWLRGKRDIEILRTEVDRDGYDIVLHCNGILRHVQLKSSYQEATTAKVDARTALEGKPSGCILWILFDQRTLELGPYLWFGGQTRRTTAGAWRQGRPPQSTQRSRHQGRASGAENNFSGKLYETLHNGRINHRAFWLMDAASPNTSAANFRSLASWCSIDAMI